jgi:hypothetical protein
MQVVVGHKIQLMGVFLRIFSGLKKFMVANLSHAFVKSLKKSCYFLKNASQCYKSAISTTILGISLDFSIFC